MSELEQELARLRAENEALRAAQAGHHDDLKAHMNAEMAKVAQAASREAMQQRMLAAGNDINAEASPAAMDAALGVMADMGLL